MHYWEFKTCKWKKCNTDIQGFSVSYFIITKKIVLPNKGVCSSNYSWNTFVSLSKKKQVCIFCSTYSIKLHQSWWWHLFFGFQQLCGTHTVDKICVKSFCKQITCPAASLTDATEVLISLLLVAVSYCMTPTVSVTDKDRKSVTRSGCLTAILTLSQRTMKA